MSRPAKFKALEIEQALKRCNGNVSRMATLLKCSRPTVHKYLREIPELRDMALDMRLARYGISLQAVKEWQAHKEQELTAKQALFDNYDRWHDSNAVGAN